MKLFNEQETKAEKVLFYIIIGFIGLFFLIMAAYSFWLNGNYHGLQQKAFEECLRYNDYDYCIEEYGEPYSIVDP